MVDEGVVWFAQVAPRQPRELVLVVPPPAWFFAPLPLVVALAGLFALRRRPEAALAPVADVVWCAAALATRPLIVAHDALLEPTAVSYWCVLAVALLVPVLGLLLLPGRVRPWVLLAVGILGSLVILGDVVYYRLFGDILSTPALSRRAGPGAPGAQSARSAPSELWLVVDWPLVCWPGVRLSRRARALFPAAARCLIAATGVLGSPFRSCRRPGFSLDAVRSGRFQRLGRRAVGAVRLSRATPDLRARGVAAAGKRTRDRAALAWFDTRAHARRAAPGSTAREELIVVQVESLQDFAVDFQVNGQKVMPHLRQWAGDGLRFTNVTDETSEGRTSDAEFTTLTSLLPLDHGAVAFRFPGHQYVALPRVLTEHGYTTLSAVAFEPGFWNRQVMHPAYGFQSSLFEPDFLMTEQIGWGLNDRDFLQQMVPRLERLPRPFAAWLITLSLHHPFADFPDRHKVLKLGSLEGTSFGNYLHTCDFSIRRSGSQGSAGARLSSVAVVVVPR
jgi:hypothetical protein